VLVYYSKLVVKIVYTARTQELVQTTARITKLVPKVANENLTQVLTSEALLYLRKAILHMPGIALTKLTSS
jgi:hypothetical protein